MRLLGPDAAHRHDPTRIRVPNSQLISEHPDWERQAVSKHHDALHLVADTLDAPDEALEFAVAQAAGAAQLYEQTIEGWRLAAAESLIAMGRALRRPIDEAQKARVERSLARSAGSSTNHSPRDIPHALSRLRSSPHAADASGCHHEDGGPKGRREPVRRHELGCASSTEVAPRTNTGAFGAAGALSWLSTESVTIHAER